jgi:hypothetical protein
MEITKEKAYEILKRYQHMPIAACIKYTSRSGMTQRIEFYAGYRKIGWAIAACLDLSWNEEGIKVVGHGFDPVYYVLDKFNKWAGKGFFNPQACQRL